MVSRSKPREGFVQRTHDFGLSTIDVTNVAEALEQLEGPAFG